MTTPTLNDIVRDAFARLRRRAGPSIDVVLDLCDCPPVVDVDPADLYEVLQHVFDNAWEAMPAGGPIVIQTRQVDLVPATSEGEPRAFSRVSVTDTGHGIPPVIQHRIFEPTFTTKGRREGLGLSTAMAMVQRHGGFLDFSTAIGTGTVFHIYLPGGAPGTDRAACIGRASAYTEETQ
jgi:two-component system, cell cycle sensor histidine kinase and response regulator CckA